MTYQSPPQGLALRVSEDICKLPREKQSTVLTSCSAQEPQRQDIPKDVLTALISNWTSGHSTEGIHSWHYNPSWLVVAGEDKGPRGEPTTATSPNTVISNCILNTCKHSSHPPQGKPPLQKATETGQNAGNNTMRVLSPTDRSTTQPTPKAQRTFWMKREF